MSTTAFTLSARERAHLDHAVDDSLEVLALPVPKGSVEHLMALIAGLEGRERGAEGLAEVLQRISQVPASGTFAALARMEHRWRGVEQRYGLLSGPQVADLAGSRAKNRSEHASALVRAGRVFAIRRSGRALYPGFQFGDDGAPLPVVAEVLDELRRADWTEEAIALWFDAPNGYLDDGRPADLLVDKPELVRRAASFAAARADW